ncbi:phosphoribosylglycinamide formyltransferase [Rhodobacter sphaeroides]|uniref:Phosphoribosylglycinamide formyltransferase n=2 Tax=Cereibacter sphaeroides TaxID=1063 RepID=Q3J516_CERS4|nr:phosphoribosylglycinamide formyltransferase [Cereibacter sphaeroides]ABA78118.2 formyltetrahydrofolate-dependent phosphoribosylglycinamide formyltransferase [Cereibacter sphaeroides 2.4.1]AMJ46490.1 phosphoribosylglycinamide formyltransferase [Cereibacter sphaeroides]ANS33202.1 phosphoribosylglycinamide formyltransferase [Cereibacter sphaeroides]ATN62247.1 phosphoribosylglycinamide formyltransferase [Cereibacter sphaeroides]AXC60348.1 phosphoribosylglycinamide formyltransferase [Cereibacter
MKRVAVLISGGGSNMLALLRSMEGAHPARPVLVASNDPAAAGLKRAAELGVPVAAVDHRPFRGDRAAFEAALLEPILAAEPDILCLAGFMRVLTPAFVARFEGRMLNIHPSLLPKYQGLHTHQRALEAGDAEAGCTVHEVTAALDDGPILGQARVPILPGDKAETLAARVLTREHALYPAVLRRFAAGDRTPLLLD